jgi:hypothetical protein
VVGLPRRSAVDTGSPYPARIDSSAETGMPQHAVNQAFEGRDGPVLQPLASGDRGSTPYAHGSPQEGISPNLEPSDLKTKHFATPGWAA